MLLSLTSRFDIDLQAAGTSPAKAKSATPAAAAASASQVYHHDAFVDFTI